MSFPFSMSHRPAYQIRRGKCHSCTFPIEPGARIMVGQSYVHIGERLLRQRRRYHESCFWAAFTLAVAEFFFRNDFKPEHIPYTDQERAELNRLNARLWYLRTKKGVSDEDAQIVGIKIRQLEIQERRKERNATR